MRRRLAPVTALPAADNVALNDFKLFGLTYAAGFLFVSLMIA